MTDTQLSLILSSYLDALAQITTDLIDTLAEYNDIPREKVASIEVAQEFFNLRKEGKVTGAFDSSKYVGDPECLGPLKAFCDRLHHDINILTQ